MGGRVVEGARLESVFRLNRLTWVRIPPHPPLNKPRLGLFLWRKGVGGGSVAGVWENAEIVASQCQTS